MILNPNKINTTMYKSERGKENLIVIKFLHPVTTNKKSGDSKLPIFISAKQC